jgi:hypothetical protein
MLAARTDLSDAGDPDLFIDDSETTFLDRGDRRSIAACAT